MDSKRPIPTLGWGNHRGSLASFDVRTIYDLLDVIRKKPGIFIGMPSLTALRGFIHGFEAALRSIGMPLEAEQPPFRGFHDWVASRHGFASSALGWNGMLLERLGDESAAFDRFFLELDAYRRNA